MAEPANDTSPGDLTTDTTALLASVQKEKRFNFYADVPKFIKVLTAGQSAVVRVPDDKKDAIVVIDTGNRQALFIVNADPKTRSLYPDSFVSVLHGALIAQNFTVSEEHCSAPTGVIRQIYASAGKVEAGNSNRGATSQYVAAAHTWFDYAIENHATDIHYYRKGNEGVVKFRVDGELEEMRTENRGRYPGEFIKEVMASLYNGVQVAGSGSDSTFSESQFMYCMIPYVNKRGNEYKMRYQSFKGHQGPACVMRLLVDDPNAPVLTLEAMGYEKTQLKVWNTAAQTPSGMICIAGVTGSGKSTAQCGFIETNPYGDQMVGYTIEDPVERTLKRPHQINFQRNLANPEESSRMFVEVVASILRGDPDYVVMGEVRDKDSAEALEQINETGCLGMCTTHAHLLSGIVPRLTGKKIGMTRDILTAPNIINTLVYQALVPRLCKSCAMTTDEALKIAADVNDIHVHFKSADLDPNLFRWKRPMGCSECGERGTKGLTVVAEMFSPHDEWLALIRDGRDVEAVLEYRSLSDGHLLSDNMNGKTVFEHTLLKSSRGDVDFRQAGRFESFDRYFARLKRPHPRTTRSPM